MRVVVTGANGFLGSHLVAALIEAGHEPIAAVRAKSSRGALRGQDVEIVAVDYGAPETLHAAFVGADAVIHAAGGGKVLSEADMDAQNLVPTQSVFRAALDVEVPRCILISSLAAVGPSAPGSPHNDNAEPAPVSRYGRSKLRAEAVALDYADQMWTLIVRPPALFGPHDTRILPLIKMVNRGVLVDIGPKQMAICSGRDAARGTVAALNASDTIVSGRAFFVAHDQSVNIKSLGERFARALERERSPLTLRLPRPLLKVAAHAMGTFAQISGRPTPFNADKLRDAAPYMECSAAGLAEATGWSQTPLDDDIARTVEWFHHEVSAQAQQIKLSSMA